MRNRLQYTEEPSLYYQRLWDIPEASLKDLIRMYKDTKILWRYRDFKDWFNRAYSYQITYSKWIGFEKYLKYYNKRKKLKIPINMKVGKQFLD